MKYKLLLKEIVRTTKKAALIQFYSKDKTKTQTRFFPKSVISYNGEWVIVKSSPHVVKPSNEFLIRLN